MKWTSTCRFFLLLWLFCAPFSHARSDVLSPWQEAIALFDVQATMRPDGVLDVRENLHFQARNRQIKHGFFRDLPRMWVRPDGNAALLTYHVIGVTRDGKPEPWQLRWHRGTMRIVVGDEQTLLPEGDYRYQVHYQVSNAFIRDGDDDMLIWNVTGDSWSFEIYQVRFALQLADAQGDPFKHIDFFTGDYGERLKNGHLLPDGHIESREPFYQQDFTVLYRWPRALLPDAAEPRATHLLPHLFIPTLSSLVVWIPCGLMAVYFLFLWLRRPRFTPVDVPELTSMFTEFSPGYLRMAAKQTYDDKGFCADVTNLIVKGRVALESVSGDQTQQCLVRVHSGASRKSDIPTQEEQLLMELLFRKGDKVVLKGRYNRTLRKAFTRMEKHYRQQHKGAWYRPSSFLLCGMAAMFATLVLANVQSSGWTSMTLMTDGFIGFFYFIPLLFSSVFLLDAHDGGKAISKSLLATLILPLIGGGLIFLFLWAKMGYSLFHWYMPAGYFSAWCLTGYITALGFSFLPQLTQSGQQRFALAEGVIHYLQRLEAATHSGRRRKGESRCLDISLLSWAVAAGLGSEWADRLTPSLAAAIVAPEIARTGALLSLQTHLSSGAYTSAFRNSSSGGGFSGGGAGGGGGGGW
ncbi:DUF2207 domain-containing protein [Klebsiella sp. RHBSTW-00484]|uniref:DUF2207 domain-containing protein n=1 Tax=unclassified Klebsiella TaxID=2608929 RepID=UPI0015E4E648|nr:MULTISPECIES: DUF2207 domain-containing protein [unclassified Klebsiella]MBA7846793.1 DUF2207 domain-containing protein [Klebsiella sp. RHBSTW-00465]QLO37287.1 DUF2207 domain-containing protein [Klebsiella sp. RHBSTW-00484]QLT76805.1 DUF2207 domain-containing protein [Klebsiella sp. RHBSTW-00464]